MDNLRGAAFMTLAMLGFAIEDMCIKLISASLPTWQIILSLGSGGALIMAVILFSTGQTMWTRAYLSPAVILRNIAEIVGSLGFVTALAVAPLSSATAILQAAPLVVTLGAALFLNEPVGWRRWSAIGVGFAGVLMIIRPGVDDFDPQVLWAALGTAGLAVRDLATRRIPKETTSVQLSFLAFVLLIPTALVLGAVLGTPAEVPDAGTAFLIVAAVVLGAGCYYLIVGAMRMGDVSFVTGFRYSRMPFALVLSVLVFQERPDAMTLLGASVIVAAGLYTLIRERKQMSQD